MKVCRKTNKERYFMLFSDLLIYGEGNQKSLNIGNIIPLTFTVKLTDYQDRDAIKNGIMIESKECSFIAYAKSAEEKAEWMKVLREQIDKHEFKLTPEEEEIERTVSVRPIFITDDDSPKCALCGMEFTFVKRRHHCRKCGKCICGDCSLGKMPLFEGAMEEKVCNTCYTEYMESIGKSTKISAKIRKTVSRDTSPGLEGMEKKSRRRNLSSVDVITMQNEEINHRHTNTSRNAIQIEKNDIESYKKELQKQPTVNDTNYVPPKTPRLSQSVTKAEVSTRKTIAISTSKAMTFKTESVEMNELLKYRSNSDVSKEPVKRHSEALTKKEKKEKEKKEKKEKKTKKGKKSDEFEISEPMFTEASPRPTIVQRIKPEPTVNLAVETKVEKQPEYDINKDSNSRASIDLAQSRMSVWNSKQKMSMTRMKSTTLQEVDSSDSPALSRSKSCTDKYFKPKTSKQPEFEFDD